MSIEYREKLAAKIREEAQVYVQYHCTTGVTAFIRKRMKHYGIKNKYLPPDFKLDEVVTEQKELPALAMSDNGNNPERIETTAI